MNKNHIEYHKVIITTMNHTGKHNSPEVFIETKIVFFYKVYIQYVNRKKVRTSNSNVGPGYSDFSTYTRTTSSKLLEDIKTRYEQYLSIRYMSVCSKITKEEYTKMEEMIEAGEDMKGVVVTTLTADNGYDYISNLVN